MDENECRHQRITVERTLCDADLTVRRYSCCYGITRDHLFAADALQKSAVKAIAKSHQCDSRNPTDWLMTITREVALRLLVDRMLEDAELTECRRRCCYRLLRDLNDVEDALQASNANAIANSHQCEPDRNPEGWLKQITRYAAFDICRLRGRAVPTDFPDLDDQDGPRVSAIPGPINPHAPGPPEEIISVPFIAKGIASLQNAQWRAVLVLDQMGFGRTEIAEILAIPLGAVDGRLNRARRALYEELRRKLDEETF